MEQCENRKLFTFCAIQVNGNIITKSKTHICYQCKLKLFPQFYVLNGLEQCIILNCTEKNALLDYPSSGTLKVKRLEI